MKQYPKWKISLRDTKKERTTATTLNLKALAMETMQTEAQRVKDQMNRESFSV